MAEASQTGPETRDVRFHYEPMLSAHPQGAAHTTDIIGKAFNFPLWVSSMTGGAAHARELNHTMARACEEFELGMGLGSCRPLLEDSARFMADFDVRDLMPGRPLFANLGIAQVEKGLSDLSPIHRMVEALRADGLIIHVNPLQEWFQPGGDLFKLPPLETITRFVDSAPYPVMVKEVGHGMGPKSLEALMRLPLAAIEFAGYGGTNFSVLEATRAQRESTGLTQVGHSAAQMTGFVRTLLARDEKFRCQRFIISGGIRDVLEGHHLTAQLPGRAVFGMAHGVLRKAQEGYQSLQEFLTAQRDQYRMAQAYLRPAQGETP